VPSDYVGAQFAIEEGFLTSFGMTVLVFVLLCVSSKSAPSVQSQQHQTNCHSDRSPRSEESASLFLSRRGMPAPRELAAACVTPRKLLELEVLVTAPAGHVGDDDAVSRLQALSDLHAVI